MPSGGRSGQGGVGSEVLEFFGQRKTYFKPSTPDFISGGKDRCCKTSCLSRVGLTRLFRRLVALPEHQKHTWPGLAACASPVCNLQTRVPSGRMPEGVRYGRNRVT